MTMTDAFHRVRLGASPPAQHAISPHAAGETGAALALLRTIVDNATDGMALFEANGDIALWNNAMCEINGFPRDVFAEFRNIGQVFRWQLENGQLERSEATLELDVTAYLGPGTRLSIYYGST